MLVYPLRYKQAQVTRIHTPGKEDEFLQLKFVCNGIITTVTYLCATCTVLFKHFNDFNISASANSATATPLQMLHHK